MERYIVFDTETPNHRNDRISSIGITVVENGALTARYYELIDPEAEFDAFNIQLTGISPKTVAGKPTFGELWPRLRPVLESGLLVAHNAPFDMGVLAKCLRHYGITWKSRVSYACTCQMGRVCIPEAPNHKLNTLSDMLEIDLDHHDASSDSLACAMLLLYMLGDRQADISRFRRVYDMESIRTATGRRSCY